MLRVSQDYMMPLIRYFYSSRDGSECTQSPEVKHPDSRPGCTWCQLRRDTVEWCTQNYVPTHGAHVSTVSHAIVLDYSKRSRWTGNAWSVNRIVWSWSTWNNLEFVFRFNKETGYMHSICNSKLPSSQTHNFWNLSLIWTPWIEPKILQHDYNLYNTNNTDFN